MGKFADLKGLNRFRKKVSALEKKVADIETILEALCKEGEEYARNLYGGSLDVELRHEVHGNYGVIIAQGDKIAYLEYGTGERGRGTYKGNLPTEEISFVSSQYGEVTVDGWTYSYAKELGFTDKPWVGMVSQAQMWETAQWLRKNAVKIIKKVVYK